MKNPHMDKIERSFYTVSTALKDGQFTKQQLEGIKMFAEHVVASTGKILKRIEERDSE